MGFLSTTKTNSTHSFRILIVAYQFSSKVQNEQRTFFLCFLYLFLWFQTKLISAEGLSLLNGEGLFLVLHLLWSAGKSWTVTPTFRSAHMHTQERGRERCASSLVSATPYSLMHTCCHLWSQTCQQQASAHTGVHTHSPQGTAVCGSRGHLESCCCCGWSVVLPASLVIRLMGASHTLKVWIFTDRREGGKGTGQGE